MQYLHVWKNNASILIQNTLLLKNVKGHLSLQDQHVLPGKHLALMLIAPDMSAEEACQLK